MRRSEAGASATFTNPSGVWRYRTALCSSTPPFATPAVRHEATNSVAVELRLKKLGFPGTVFGAVMLKVSLQAPRPALVNAATRKLMVWLGAGILVAIAVDLVLESLLNPVPLSNSTR
jgi:hypothetical protein